MATMKINNFDAIVSLMNDETREAVHMDMAPCSDGEFLAEYLDRDPGFRTVLQQEFSDILAAFIDNDKPVYACYSVSADFSSVSGSHFIEESEISDEIIRAEEWATPLVAFADYDRARKFAEEYLAKNKAVLSRGRCADANAIVISTEVWNAGEFDSSSEEDHVYDASELNSDFHVFQNVPYQQEDLEEAIRAAAVSAYAYPGSEVRVILWTDGEFTHATFSRGDSIRDTDPRQRHICTVTAPYNTDVLGWYNAGDEQTDDAELAAEAYVEQFWSDILAEALDQVADNSEEA